MSTLPTTSDDTMVEQHDGLVVVTLNRPEKKNAIGSRIWADLDAILNEVTVEPSCRALLLTGAGGNFSSGADLSPGMGNEPAGEGDADGKQSKGGLTGRGAQAVLHEMRTIGEVLVKLQRLPKPTVAAVDGVCYGVGFGLAMACDLVVASDRARFCEVFVKRGMALDGGTSWTLPRAIGTRRAKQMAYFGEPVDAATALDWGLVNEVVPADDLADTGLAWAQRLATGPDHGAQPHQAAHRRQRRVVVRRHDRGRGPRPAHRLQHQGHPRGHRLLPREARPELPRLLAKRCTGATPPT